MAHERRRNSRRIVRYTDTCSGAHLGRPGGMLGRCRGSHRDSSRSVAAVASAAVAVPSPTSVSATAATSPAHVSPGRATVLLLSVMRHWHRRRRRGETWPCPPAASHHLGGHEASLIRVPALRRGRQWREDALVPDRRRRRRYGEISRTFGGNRGEATGLGHGRLLK